MRIVSVVFSALAIACAAPAESDVIAKAVVPEPFLKKFARATIHRSDDILNVEIRELSPDERVAVSQKLSQYKAIVPTVIRRSPPFYPYRLRIQGVSGHVEAIAVVSSKGTVQDVYLCSYTNVEFAQAAGLALKMWRFKPTEHDFVVRIPIPFRIENAQPEQESQRPQK